mmetsp:Transcript_5121/g.23053  ORF Transcript_5121/g.23053 Transcript_5121/m.23053 type:complete len:421 (+) Transcript_5121:193-1455(+)
MACLMLSLPSFVTTWISCTCRPARASRLYPSSTTTLVSHSSRSWLTTLCSTACLPGITASMPSSVSRFEQMSINPGSGVSSSSSSSTEGSGIATGMIVSSVSSSGSACSCFKENVTLAGLRPSAGTTSSTLTSTSSPTRSTSRGCATRDQLSSEMWINPSNRGACGSSCESSTKAPKSERETTCAAARTPGLSFLTPRSWTSARSETTIFLSLTSVTMTSMTLPTCASSAATVASLVDALGSTGARGAMFRSMSSSSSKDARGAVTALGALFFLLRLTSRVLEEVICESGRKARKRPLRTRRMRPPRLATSTRPLTGSPFSSARISAFLASVLLESPSSSSFLALPPGPFLAPSFFAGGLGSFAVAAARTKRTGLDGGMATLRDLVLDERGAGATRLELTDRARAAPRLAAHCKTDVAIA